MPNLADATEILRLLGDPTRLRLLALLAREELTVVELCGITGLRQSRVSTHLARLREAGLVQDRPAGTSSYYRLQVASLPGGARELWESASRASEEDPLVRQDEQRMKEALRARRNGAASTAAGQMERHYIPGRTWESLHHGLAGLMQLRDVLDVGAGDCALAELLAPRARSVTCLDLDASVLARAGRRLAAHGNVHLREGDMHALPFADASFDQVLLMLCLTHSPEPAIVVQEASRVLRPGGVVVAATLKSHRHREVAARFGHVQLGFSVKRLEALFADAGLDVAFCDVTNRVRRTPPFEIVCVHARKPERKPRRKGRT